jgi:hypothetical protein
MDGVTKIPSGRMAMATEDGKSFSIDPVEACKAIDRIARETDGKTNYEYLDLFAGWVKEQTEGVVTLTATEADWCIDYIRVERARAKKNTLETLNSLTATEVSTSPA